MITLTSKQRHWKAPKHIERKKQKHKNNNDWIALCVLLFLKKIFVPLENIHVSAGTQNNPSFGPKAYRSRVKKTATCAGGRLYGTARAYSRSGTMALWAFSGPPVTLSITCQTDAQPKKSRFESSLSFMYDGSFSLICRQIVLRQNAGDISSQKFV